MSQALIDENYTAWTVRQLRDEVMRRKIGPSGWRQTARQSDLITALETGKGPDSVPVTTTAAAGGTGLEAIIAGAIAPLLQSQISRAEFDGLAESWAEQSEAITALQKRVSDLETLIESGDVGGGANLTVAYTSPLPSGVVRGLCHRQLPQIITWASAGVPVWLWGGAGAGKTAMARQVAAALNLTPYVLSIDPTMTVGKLVGFRAIASGEFTPGFLLAPYRDGGLVMLDEVDTGDPGILAALNSLLANEHYTFPDGTEVARHPNFRVIAGANTKGTGPVAGYTARNRLDAATLNRFAVIELLVDEGLEVAIVCGGANESKPWQGLGPLSKEAAGTACLRWVKWVQKARAAVASGNSVLISPRAAILGAAALRAGVPVTEVADALVFALTTTDTKANIRQAAGVF